MAKKNKGSKASNPVKGSGKTRKIPTHMGKWHIGELIVGGLASIVLLIALLAPPSYTTINNVEVFSDGIIAPAIIFGAIIWAVIETLTPPGKGTVDLIWRAFAGFVIGGFIGGFLGYEFHFANYILVPAYNGNGAAILYLVSILIFGVVVIWDAAWSDRKGYMGQHGSKVHTIAQFHESGTGKAARKFLGLFIALISVFLMIFLSASVGHALVSTNDNSSVLQAQSITTYVYDNTTAIPFAQVNGTATFDFPANVSEIWVQSNLTVAELNNFAVAKLVLSTSDSHAANVSIGTGTNVSNFAPFAYQSLKNFSTASFAISPSALTGNQSANIMLLIQSNVTSISLTMHAYGNTGLVTSFGSYPAEQMGYLIGTIFTVLATVLVAPWYDIGVFDKSKGRH